jgi:hypothetical protein
VQEQHSSNGSPRTFLVIYGHEHTCDLTSPAAAAPETARSPTDPLDFSAGLSRQQPGGGVVQLSKEELEQQALVSSLACVLQGSQQCYSGGGSPEEWLSPGRVGEDGAPAPAPAVSIETSTELDVMDYDVTDTVYFGASSSYGGDDGMLLNLRGV